MSKCNHGRREGDMYLCNIRCEFIKNGNYKNEFTNQCCCECRIDNCFNRCDMKGNNNRTGM